MWLLISPLLTWIFRGVVVQFLVLTAVVALVVFLVPFAIEQIGAFIGTSGLSSAFSGLPAGIWYFIDLARLDFGVPWVLSAFVARFLVRRLPVIG